MTAADVTRGLELLGAEVVTETVDDVLLWWLADEGRPPRTRRPRLRSRFLGDPNRSAALAAWRDRSLPGNVILVDGRAAGHRKRTLAKDGVRLEVHALNPLDGWELRGLERAAAELGRFLGGRAPVDVVSAESGGPRPSTSVPCEEEEL